MNLREFDYFIGFFQTDGNLYETTRNRGKIVLEISNRDEDILKKIKSVLTVKSSLLVRTRNTNFKENYCTSRLVIYDLTFREKIKEFCSITAGKKDETIFMPSCVYSPSDYFRGVIDGDGSVGFKEDGTPFISLVTNSEELYRDFTNFIFIITGQRKLIKRNQRDGVYNIFITAEHAVNIIRELYHDNPTLFLNRKYEKAMEILKWKRSAGKRRSPNRNPWTNYEDEFILNNSLKDSVRYLYRSEQSIKTRLYRIKNNQKE